MASTQHQAEQDEQGFFKSRSTGDQRQKPFAFNQSFVDEDPHSKSSEIVSFRSSKLGDSSAQSLAAGGGIPFASKAGGKKKRLPPAFNPHRRTSVSAETLNANGGEDSFSPPVISKTKEQLQRLSKTVVCNFLFSTLDQDSLTTVLLALKEMKFSKGSAIIVQHDEGDFFYVVEDGQVEYYVDGEIVSSSGAGSCFGELALMYNSARAATVVAKTDVILWALDRMTFRQILYAKTSKKRQLYESFLREVPVLKNLSIYERSKLADALNVEHYKKDDTIIEEGDIGDNFYLIISGETDVVKKAEGVVNHLRRGDYFGELALLNDLPRQASIIATTDVDVATLDSRGFQRLLGPAFKTMSLHDPTKH